MTDTGSDERPDREGMPSLRTLVLLFTVPSLVAALHVQLFSHLNWSPIAFWQAAAWQGLPWYVWVPLTPLVVRLARRVPIEWRPSAAALAVHAGGVLVAATAFGLVYLVADHAFAPASTRAAAATSPLAAMMGRSVMAWLPMNGVMYFAVLGVSQNATLTRRVRDRERAALRLERDLTRARLDALQAQLRPHFLFNTLNTVVGIVERDPAGARRVVEGLSELLRAALHVTGEQEVSVAREVEILRHYVAIQEERFRPRVAVHVCVDPAVRDALVPAMLLQPLVENALQHGVTPRARGGTVTVSIGQRGDTLAIVVADDGVGLRPEPVHERVGLGNTRARLGALYGPAHHLSLAAREGGGAQSVVTLPLRRAPGDAR